MRRIYLSIMLMCIAAVSKAQTAASYVFSQSLGTYSPITGTNVHGTLTTWDDNSVAVGAIPIGFDFTYLGTSYTGVGLNSNGWITFGPSSASTYTPISLRARSLAPMGEDLYRINAMAPDNQIIYNTIGTAPTRTFVVQWTNVCHYSNAASGPLNFQVRLYESSNVIEFSYGDCSPTLATTYTAQVGINGAATSDYNNRTTTSNWTATTAGGSSTATCSRNSSVFPPSGLTFRWTPPPFISVSPASLSFTTGVTTTSGQEDATLVAYGLTSGLVAVNAPTNFQIYNGSTWVTSMNVPVVAAAAGTYINTTVPVRFVAPATAGPYSGSLPFSSAGATTQNIALSGTAQSLCFGTPTAGTVSATVPSGSCAPFATTLSLSGATSGTGGLTYQWQTSPDNVAPYTNVTGATDATYDATVGSTIYYRAIVGCSISGMNSTTPGNQLVYTPPPTAITGSANICVAATSTLASTPAGGTWTSSDPAVAGVNSSTGVVTGMSAGTATITYTITSSGCIATKVATINPIPPTPTVTPSSAVVCSGQVTTLTVTSPMSGNNTVSSGPISVAIPDASTVGATTSLTVAGVPAGATITGISFNFNITHTYVGDLELGLTAPNGSTLNFYDQHGGGGDNFSNTTVSSAGVTTFSSSSAPYTGTYAASAVLGTGPTGYIANVTSFSDLYSVPNGDWILSARDVFGGDIGTFDSWSITISYTMPPVTFEWTPLTDLYTDAGLLTPYTGTDLTTVYASGSTVGSIVYTATSTSNGCTNMATASVTTNPLPAAIGGVFTFCEASTTLLTNADAGGTWSSSNTSVATIDANSGLATGIAQGTTTVTYLFTATGCYRTATLLVNPIPAAITGTMQVCEGATVTLADADAGGTWLSGNVSIATANMTTGEVIGVSAGTAIISYRFPTGCVNTATVSVNPLPLLTVTPSTTTTLCLGESTSAYSANATMPGFSLLNQNFNSGIGAWTTNSPVGAPSAFWQIVPSPGAGGTTGDGTAMMQANANFTSVVTMLTSPSFSTVGYGSAVLTFNQFLLSDVSDAAVAVEYSVNGGAWTELANYTNSTEGTGTWAASSPEATLPLPAPAIGQADVRIRWNYTAGSFFWLIDNIKVDAALPAATYTWTGGSELSCTTCTNPAITPSASGMNVYTVTATSSAACTSNGTVSVSVNPLPAMIGGTMAVCEGLTTTITNADGGGTWASGDAMVATIDASTGVLTGVMAGTVTVTYTLPTGCERTGVVTVNALPAAIGGTLDVCVGLTTTLTNVTTDGTWTSSSTGVATIDGTTGVLTGVMAGNTTVTYTKTATGCIMTDEATVNPLPAAIAGTQDVCAGLTTTLTNADAGGIWTSGDMTVATIDGASGVATGVMAGNAMITYMLPTGCITSAEVTVNALPAVITGTMEVCAGLNTMLSDATAGGTWTSGDIAVATIDGTSGIATGVMAGNAMITYTLPTGCIQTADLSVNPLPAAITGTMDVCEGLTTTLANVTTGGTWTSGDMAVATIDAGGVVTGVLAGNATVSYTLSATGCIATSEMTVNALPDAITGTMDVCEGLTTMLSDATAGGSWSSSDVSMATVDATGLVTGVAAGNPMVTYTLPTGCIATAMMTVNALPGVITGGMQVCEGLMTTLGSATASGSWTSSATGVATIDPITGEVTGIMAGTSEITYTLITGCLRTTMISVNPTPSAITGADEVCVGSVITFMNADAGGSWTSTDVTIASVDGATGDISGVMAGTTAITYTLPTSCLITKDVLVNPLPVVNNVTGGGSYCFSGTGVSVGLDNSTATDTYELYEGSTLMGTQSGTGSTVDFGMQTVAGVYTVVATTDRGCVTNMSGDATVVIIPLVTPVVTIATTPGDTVCAGTTVTFTATPVNGGTLPAYSWDVNGTATSSTTDSYSFVPVDGDVITVALTSDEACPSPATVTDSKTMIVVSNETPVVTVTPYLGVTQLSTGDTVCQGSTVIYTASDMFGGDAPEYTWYKNGVSTGATGMVYTYAPVLGDVIKAEMVSNYRCPIVNNVMSSDVVLRVDSVYIPVLDLSVSPGLEIAPGTSVTFAASVTKGGVVPTYQWIVNSVPVVGQTSTTYTSSTLGNNDSVTCVVWGTGDCSFFTFNSVRVKVTTGFVQPATGITALKLMPNPNTGDFVVNGNLAGDGNGEVSFSVTDMLGQIVYRNAINVRNGTINEHISLSNTLANGMYMLNVCSGSDNHVFHFVLKQ